MPISSIIDVPEVLQLATETLQNRILEHLNEETVMSLDTLVTRLPQYSWSQIFHSIDHLARTNKIVLRRHGFDYTLFSRHFAD